jgi:hypothetical protein
MGKILCRSCGEENWVQATVDQSLPDPYDLALLRFTPPPDTHHPPCVQMDGAFISVQPDDPLYSFGHPYDGDPLGEPGTFSCVGITGSEIQILFNSGQVQPGMSGAPLLNRRTKEVCGIINFTRDRSSDLGGGAIPTYIILEQFPRLRELQREFHIRDYRWRNASNPTPPELTPPVDIDTLVQVTREANRERIQNRCGWMRILDVPQPIEMIGDNGIFTNVNILEWRKKDLIYGLVQD